VTCLHLEAAYSPGTLVPAYYSVQLCHNPRHIVILHHQENVVSESIYYSSDSLVSELHSFVMISVNMYRRYDTPCLVIK
jgi:hypothetical protein